MLNLKTKKKMNCMKNNFFAKALSSIFLLCCSAFAFADDAQEIINVKDGDYVNFANYDYAIKLPNTGYHAGNSSMAPSFINDVDGVVIELVQVDRTDVENTKAILQSSSTDWSRYKINGVETYLYKAVSKGISEFNYMVMLYLGENIPIEVRVKYSSSIEDRMALRLQKCLLSFVYTGPTSADSKTFCNSSYCIENGGFKERNIGLLLTTFCKSGDPNLEMNQGRKVYFQIMMQQEEIAKSKRKKTAASLLKGILERNDKVKATAQKNIGGLPAYCYDIEQKDENGELVSKKYITVIFSQKEFFLFTSCANADIDKNISEFKRISETFKSVK